MDDPAWEPPLSAGEHEHLFGMLDRLRATFRYKADGLDAAQLGFRLPSSALSLGGLLQHLAAVEDEKFTWLIARREPHLLLKLTDDGRNPFDIGAADPAQLYGVYDRAVAASREIQQTLTEPGALEADSALDFNGEHPSVRRLVCDLIEEYGRHTGHADLLREAIDGRVGEDPPWDYLPPWYAR